MDVITLSRVQVQVLQAFATTEMLLLGFLIYAVVNFALMLQVEEHFNNSQVFMMDWVPDFITPMSVIIVIYVSQTIGWVSRKA